MKFKLTASTVFCAVLLLGCSSAPTLAVPTGEWADFTQSPQPHAFIPIAVSPPAAYNQGPATTVYKPTEVAAFTPPKTPGSTAVKPAVPVIVLPVVEKALPPAVPAPVLPMKSVTPALNQAGVAPAVTTAPGPVTVGTTAPTGKSVVPSAADKSKPAPVAPARPLALAEVKPAVPAPKPAKAYVVRIEDKTIRGTLTRWAREEGYAFEPKGPNYWTVPDDFDVVANDTMYGEFKDVVRRLIASTELTNTPLQPCFYKNRVVRVILFNEECRKQASLAQNP